MAQVLARHTTPEGVEIVAARGDMCAEECGAIVNAANHFLKHNGGVAAAIRLASAPDYQAVSDAWVKANGPLVVGTTAAFTPAGGKLKCKGVIHVVGPIYREKLEGEVEVKGTILSISGEEVRMKLEDGAEVGFKIYRTAAEYELKEGGKVRSLGKMKEGAFAARYVTGVDYTVTRSDEDLLGGAITAALAKCDSEGLDSICIPAISSGVFGFPLARCAEVHVESALSYAKSSKSLKKVTLMDFSEGAANAFATAVGKLTGAAVASA
mmetsp:Transcript_2243/g.4992  ORF Transcript_2243/g.4992 Transcript_2243/m.4992 type:complete len:267 (-) Transcript_2243:93-893(-)|eukprot:CAMPEP_0172065322 /NCGR_PEP_ID=MMETSP1043-20130122/10576_1 /TAXON_ID=464988 /ORGANISM="Hemiselmis andersenii, Strain CCMP441" /LENGTH=266 /DNA_ID=CAMNT_0012725427 /DNA_START=1 /DNA_END=801 /DNA_ORIENTATION=-